MSGEGERIPLTENSKLDDSPDEGRILSCSRHNAEFLDRTMRISDLKPLVQAVLHPAFRFGLLPCVLLLCSATTVRAVPILVGTYASGNDSTTDFTAHNALIEDYNL